MVSIPWVLGGNSSWGRQSSEMSLFQGSAAAGRAPRSYLKVNTSSAGPLSSATRRAPEGHGAAARIAFAMNACFPGGSIVQS